MVRRQEAITPVARPTTDKCARIRHHHKARKAAVFRSKAIAHPASKPRTPGENRPGQHVINRRDVVVGITLHRADEGKFIHMFGNVWKQA